MSASFEVPLALCAPGVIRRQLMTIAWQFSGISAVALCPWEPRTAGTAVVWEFEQEEGA